MMKNNYQNDEKNIATKFSFLKEKFYSHLIGFSSV